METWVSVLEQRTLCQDRLIREGIVAINGPEVVHCDTVVREGLKSYWSKARRAGEGHWIRRSDNIQSYTVSKVIDNLLKKTKCNIYGLVSSRYSDILRKL